jgi:hypothetical protein
MNNNLKWTIPGFEGLAAFYTFNAVDSKKREIGLILQVWEGEGENEGKFIARTQTARDSNFFGSGITHAYYFDTIEEAKSAAIKKADELKAKFKKK